MSNTTTTPAGINKEVLAKQLSRSAFLYDADGYLQNKGFAVYDHGDEISIGSTVHFKDALTITETEITNGIWKVLL